MPALDPERFSIGYASLLLEADLLVKEGLTEDATALYAALSSAQWPKFSWGPWGVARCASVQRVTTDELESLTRASKLAPHESWASSWVGLGKLYYALGQAEEARESFEQALRLQPWSFMALVHMASIFGEAGDYGMALSFADRALDVKPNCAKVYHLRAQCFEAQGMDIQAHVEMAKFRELGGWDQDPSDYLISIPTE
jgi:tetratricopeptide (TPR) repeat protein